MSGNPRPPDRNKTLLGELLPEPTVPGDANQPPPVRRAPAPPVPIIAPSLRRRHRRRGRQIVMLVAVGTCLIIALVAVILTTTTTVIGQKTYTPRTLARKACRVKEINRLNGEKVRVRGVVWAVEESGSFWLGTEGELELLRDDLSELIEHSDRRNVYVMVSCRGLVGERPEHEKAIKKGTVVTIEGRIAFELCDSFALLQAFGL